MTVFRMRFACCIPKAIPPSEYVIRIIHLLLIAFTLRGWLKERASVLRYTSIACLVQLAAV